MNHCCNCHTCITVHVPLALRHPLVAAELTCACTDQNDDFKALKRADFDMVADYVPFYVSLKSGPVSGVRDRRKMLQPAGASR